MIEINDKKYYSVEEAGNLLGVAPSCIRVLVRKGKLHAFKPSERKTYIELSEIQKYIEK